MKNERDYKVIGFTDSVHECDCCGKQDLKGTFCVELGGEELYFGSVCAMKKHGVEERELKVAKRKSKGLEVYTVAIVKAIDTTPNGRFVQDYSLFELHKEIEFTSKTGANNFLNQHKEECQGNYNSTPKWKVELTDGNELMPTQRSWFAGNPDNGFAAIIR